MWREYYLETGREWPEGSFEHCRDNSDAILLGAIGWPGARLPNGDLAGGQVILGLRSGLNLYANVRPVKLFQGVKHKVHGIHKDIWDPNLVNMVMVREYRRIVSLVIEAYVPESNRRER